MADFTNFHAFFFHNSLLFHSSSKINMESLQTTPQTLLISQRIQRFKPKFTQILQNLGIGKDSLSTYYQLELGCIPNKTLEKGTNLISKENPSNPYPSSLCTKIIPKSIQFHTQTPKIHTKVMYPYLGLISLYLPLLLLPSRKPLFGDQK